VFRNDPERGVSDVGRLLASRRNVWLGMRLSGRWLGVFVVSGLAIACAAGFASGTASGRAATRARSVCVTAGSVATWSPDGKRIAFVGSAGRPHSICVADADGRHAQPLPHTECGKRCHLPSINTFSPLVWVKSRLLLYLADFQIYKLQIGQAQQLLGAEQGGIDTFAADPKGDRVALGSTVCSLCRGPVTVLGLPTGQVVGQIGGPSADNYAPSFSPSGKRLVFTEAAPTSEVWTASADGSDLQPLKQCGIGGIWSPKGSTIACLTNPRGTPRCCSLSLVSPQSSKITLLLPRGVHGQVFSWSPNGRRIVFTTGNCSCRLEVIYVHTRKTRLLRIGVEGAGAVDWSPDSRQLLVSDPSAAHPNCAVLWRVPVDGTPPRRIRNCS
jgi:WD40 repeat protein